MNVNKPPARLNFGPDYIVGIGASAGGLEVFKQIVPELKEGQRTAYVLLQHLDPEYPSLLDKILSNQTDLRIELIKNGLKLESDTIYINPANKICNLVNGCWHTQELKTPHPHNSIDELFEVLAESFSEKAIGVLLSGNGRDGTYGVRRIKAEGGWVIVQDPASSKYGGLPKAAIDAGLADLVCQPKEIANEINRIVSEGDDRKKSDPGSIEQENQSTENQLLSLLKAKTGFDFYRYKSSTLNRRINRRMSIRKVKSLVEYIPLVEESDSEATHLMKDLFITVTEFFRDKEVFDALSAIIARMAKEASGFKDKESIRIWVPGCATGEEAYSLAILINEQLQKEKLGLKVLIFATDIDSGNIDIARKGEYSVNLVKNIPPPLLEKYFNKLDHSYAVKKEIRGLVVFAQHDLLVDPPFSNIDLLCCRNVLIYFNSEYKTQLLETFHYSLNHNGIFVVGTSEAPDSNKNLFTPINGKLSIYRSSSSAKPRITPAKGNSIIRPQLVKKRVTSSEDLANRINAGYFAEYAPATVLLNSRLELSHLHGDLTPYLNLPQGEFKLNILDLTNAKLRLEMLVVLQKAQRTMSTVRGRPLLMSQTFSDESGSKESTKGKPGTKEYLTLVAIPVSSANEPRAEKEPPEILLVFERSSAIDNNVDGDIDNKSGTNKDQMIFDLDQQLSANRDQLDSAASELEKTNYELHSVAEEYLSTTEELQSANEELQTANEELQSTNEEMSSVNEELKTRTDELTYTNSELESILNLALAGIIVLDKNMQVTRYSASCKEIFSLWPKQSQPLHALMARLSMFSHFSDRLQLVLDTSEAQEIEVKLQQKYFLVKLFPVSDPDGATKPGLVIAFYDETERLASEAEARFLSAIVKDSNDAIVVHDSEGSILNYNQGAAAMYGYTEAEANKLNIRDLIPETLHDEYDEFIQKITPESPGGSMESRRKIKDGRIIDVWVTVTLLIGHAGENRRYALTERDITRKKLIENRLIQIIETSPDSILIVSEKGIIQQINPCVIKLFGYAEEELIGQSYELLIPDRFRKNRKRMLDDYVKNPYVVHMGVDKLLFAKSKAGEDISVTISINPIRINDDHSLLVRIRDVRKELEQKNSLILAKKEAEKANRAKSRFLAAASHDLRQPLQSISMYLGSLANERSAEKQRNIVLHSKESLDAIHKVLDSLLDLSKLESGVIVPDIADFALDEVLRRVCNIEAPLAANKQQILKCVHSSVRVRSDRSLIEVVLTNLVSNAIKYTSTGGRILVGSRRSGEVVKVQVWDNGRGIPADEIGNIFDEYVQLDTLGQPNSGGLGLGLAIVKGIVGLLGLHLTVKSIPGDGSVFTIELPLSKSVNKIVRKTNISISKPKHLSGRILLVDDNLAILEATKLFLELSGLEVIVATGFEQVQEYADSSNQSPDVIVSDYRLENQKDGLMLILHLREFFKKEIPALIISGDTSPHLGNLAASANCKIEYKPIDSDKLLSLIEEMLR